MQRVRPAVIAVLFALLAALSLSLRPITDEPTGALRNYRNESNNGAPAFPIVQRAARSFRESQGPTGMISFLTTHVQQFPNDPNNGYYLTVVADLYQDEGARALLRGSITDGHYFPIQTSPFARYRFIA